MCNYILHSGAFLCRKILWKEAEIEDVSVLMLKLYVGLVSYVIL